MNKDTFLDYNYLKSVKNILSKPDNGTAIITGGCGRIGSIFTGLFLMNNIKVIILSKTKKKFTDYRSTLPPEIKKNIFWKKMDLTNSKSIESTANILKKKRLNI